MLLAQNEAGYRNLMRLASALWLDPTDGDEPHIPFAALRGERGPHRADRRPGRADRPGAETRTWRRRRKPAQAPFRGVRLAPLCRDPAPRARQRAGDRAGAHRSRRPPGGSRWSRPTSLILPTPPTTRRMTLCSASPKGRWSRPVERRRLSPEHRFKTRAEMIELFADLPEATEASVEIAMRCAYRPLTRKPILPRFSVAGGAAVDEEQELRRQAREGLQRAPRRPRPRARTHARKTTRSASPSSSTSSST